MNCFNCYIESFKGDLYMGKNSGTKDTCIGVPVSFQNGLLKLDTNCWTFKSIGQWPVTQLNDLMSTDSILYIGLNYPSSTFGYYISGYDRSKLYSSWWLRKSTCRLYSFI